MSESLKAFSLRVYDAEGVREALLDLQDTAGCDVTLVLWCCWLAATGRAAGDGLHRALDWSRDWGDAVTRPLRAARQAIKPHAETDEGVAVLRQRVKTLELESEIITLERLNICAQGTAMAGDFRSLAAANLTAYAAAAGLNASFETVISRILPAVEK
ncbi:MULTISPECIES: TIGR02444 family protein [Hyphobacterium]|uniref:TIGR02444 family protein n=1 Tax=Hyphobacterium vulgare TaxID=1736751 RepID=A0ABV6ZW77_9PROT